jgi:hypothetical protein
MLPDAQDGVKRQARRPPAGRRTKFFFGTGGIFSGFS